MERYELNIYRCEDVDRELGVPIVVFENDMPFGAISKGDLLDPKSWDESFEETTVLFRVLGVEHAFFKGVGLTKHEIRVFVEPLDNTEENRCA